MLENYTAWEPKTFTFRGYDPYVEGVKPPFFIFFDKEHVV